MESAYHTVYMNHCTIYLYIVAVKKIISTSTAEDLNLKVLDVSEVGF